MKYKTPETFTVGEEVLCRHNGNLISVKVLAVAGNEVKVATLYGRAMTFHSRLSDGQHVGQFTEEFEAKPDIIFHTQPVTEAREGFFSRLVGAFS